MGMKIVKLTENERNNILENLLKRSPGQYVEYENTVREILDNIRERKDEALFAYTEKFDGVKINAGNIKVTKEEIEEAYKAVDPGMVDIIRKSLANIYEYHKSRYAKAGLTASQMVLYLDRKLPRFQGLVYMCQAAKLHIHLLYL